MSSSNNLKSHRCAASAARLFAAVLFPVYAFCADYSHAQDAMAAAPKSNSATDLKAQFDAASNKEKIPHLDQFNDTDGDFDQANSKLQDQEAEILKKMKPVDGAPVPASSAVESKTATSDSQDRAGFGTLQNNSVHARRISAEAETVNKETAEANAAVTASLNKKISDSQTKIETLQRELKEARDRLVMSETEVERLSQMLEKRGMSGLVTTHESPVKTSAASAAVLHAPAEVAPVPVVARAQPAPASHVQPPEDLQVATVSVEKANLRSGPGTENSSLMSVSKGTRLVIETRRGSWYRVFAPNGSRAWVTGDVLVFNNGSENLIADQLDTAKTASKEKMASSNDRVESTLRIRAFDASADKESNRLLGHAQ